MTRCHDFGLHFSGLDLEKMFNIFSGYLLSIHLSSLAKCLFVSLANFLIVFFKMLKLS